MKRIILCFILMHIFNVLNGQVTSDYVYNVQNIDEIRSHPSINFVAGDAIQTQGYYNPNDGGHAYYIVENNNIVDNGGDILRISGTPLIARLVPNEVVNVKQFGAKGINQGNNIDTFSIQKAIDYCLLNKISTLKIPAGMYRISETLVIANIGNNTDNRVSGLNIFGEGSGSTILKSLGSHIGSMIDIQGLYVDNNISADEGRIPSTYINGGRIQDISFESNFSIGNETNHCIRFIAWWNGNISNCVMSGFKGDGVRQESYIVEEDPEGPENPFSNPDFSTSQGIKFQNVIIKRCEGYGFNNTIGQGAPAFTFDKCIFSLCRKGGAYIQSSSIKFTSCSFNALGWSVENDINNPDEAYGIYFGGTNLIFNSRHIVEGCEFDNNKTAHIAASFLSNSRIANNRFIHQYRNNGYEIEPSGQSIIFAPNIASEAVRNVEFTSNFFRIYSNPTSTFNTVTLFDWINTSNVVNLYLKMNTISDNSNGSVVITPFKGYTVSNNHIKNNYVIDNRGISAKKTIVSYGSPAPFYIGMITPNPNPIINSNPNSMHPLIFDIEDPIFDSANFKNEHYDTNTGIFTCPYTGFYEMDVQLSLRNLLVNEKARMHIKKNGSIAYSEYVWGTSNTRINLDISTKFFANKDDEITIEVGSSGPTLQVDNSSTNYGFNRLHIELAN